AVAFDGHRRPVEIERYVGGNVAQRLQLFTDEIAKIDRFRVELYRPGERQQPLDGLQQQARFFFRALQPSLVDIVDAASAMQVHVAENRRQRAAELGGDSRGDPAELGRGGHLL